MLRFIIEFVLFAASTGVFFNEELRKNKLAVIAAGLIALASTVTLVRDQFKSLQAEAEPQATPSTDRSNQNSAPRPPISTPPSVQNSTSQKQLCVTFNNRQVCE